MRLNEIYNIYKDRMEFLCIYTREAHSSDGWQVQDNLDEDIIFAEPTTIEERTEAASACQINLDIQMPTLVDSMDNDVEGKYISLPMRLFLIDADGMITYTGGQGPRNFDSEEWVDAIENLLAG